VFLKLPRRYKENDMKSIKEFAEKFEIEFNENPQWIDKIGLIEKICRQYKGYFIFKIDGARNSNIYTYSINLPVPVDVVIRKDIDDIDKGVDFVLSELNSYLG
jgi:hypothetical protein